MLSVLALVCMALSAPAAALDCVMPQGRVETALCADPVLRAADHSLAAVAQSLAQGLRSSDSYSLMKAQQRFVARRAECAGDDDALSTCILILTDARRMQLSATHLAGSGPSSPLIPEFRGQVGGPRQIEADVLTIRFVSPKLPGERAFNRTVDQFIHDVPFDMRPDPDAGPTAFHADMQVTYATPEFISATIQVSTPKSGGENPPTFQSINQFSAAADPASFSDLFEPRVAARLSADCETQILSAKMAQLELRARPDLEPGERAAVTNAVGDLSAWSIEENGAVVHFPSQSLGPYVDDAFACRYSRAALSPFLRPGVTIWR